MSRTGHVTGSGPSCLQIIPELKCFARVSPRIPFLEAEMALPCAFLGVKWAFPCPWPWPTKQAGFLSEDVGSGSEGCTGLRLGAVVVDV